MSHLAAVLTVELFIVGYYIELACAYNIDDLYHIRQIDARNTYSRYIRGY